MHRLKNIISSNTKEYPTKFEKDQIEILDKIVNTSEIIIEPFITNERFEIIISNLKNMML